MAKKIFTQDPEKYLVALAAKLKDMPEFVVPEWAAYVKSGASRSRPPVSEDFWFIRAASILRQLYIRGVVGVGSLRNRYGSRKNRGGKPDEFRKASGKIIRLILQQAESVGLVEKVNKLQHGRRLSERGREFLDSIEVEDKIGVDIDAMVMEVNLDENHDVIEEDKIEEDSKDEVEGDKVDKESKEDIE